MAKYIVFEVWAGDLNSLYDEQPLPAVLVERCGTLEVAERVKKECQTHTCAAWIKKVEEE